MKHSLYHLNIIWNILIQTLNKIRDNNNERIANVFVDFGSAKHGKIDERLICRATHNNNKIGLVER